MLCPDNEPYPDNKLNRNEYAIGMEVLTVTNGYASNPFAPKYSKTKIVGFELVSQAKRPVPITQVDDKEQLLDMRLMFPYSKELEQFFDSFPNNKALFDWAMSFGSNYSSIKRLGQIY